LSDIISVQSHRQVGFVALRIFIIICAVLSFIPSPLFAEWLKLLIVFNALLFLFAIAHSEEPWFICKRLIVLLPLIFGVFVNIIVADCRFLFWETYLQIVIPMIGIAAVSFVFLRSEQDFIVLAKTITICSILVASLGFFEVFFHFDPLYEYVIENPYYSEYIEGFVRPMSTLYNPVTLGSYMLGILPFSYYLNHQVTGAWRLIGRISTSCALVMIFLVLSRGVFIGFCVGMTTYLLLKKHYAIIAAFSACVVLVVILLTFAPYPLNRYSLWGFFQEGASIFSAYRFDRVLMAWQVFRDNPWGGIGLQHFRIHFFEYFMRAWNEPYEFRIFDNMYLTLLAETGVAGVVGFCLLMRATLYKVYHHLTSAVSDTNFKEIIRLLVSGLTALLANMAAYDLFYWPNVFMLFCLVICCLLSLDSQAVPVHNNGIFSTCPAARERR
jgi:hypothetical protein